MKKINTLRVQGDDLLIIVKDESVIRVTSTDIEILWVMIIVFVLTVTYMVHKFKRGLSFVNKVAFELDGVDLKIAKQAESIKPMAEDYFDEIARNTSTINAKVKGNFDQLETKWDKLLLEWKSFRDNREAQDQEVRLLSERLRTHLERLEPVEVSEVDISNPF